jgi:2-iminobutanoate/2-iminopropanoate deaminase
MKLEHVTTPHAPQPIGPYSQAVACGNELYCSGQIPLDPQTGEMVEGDAAVQAERVIENLGAFLCAAGYEFANVVKTTIYLVDMRDFPPVNRVYEKYFGATKPARSTVAVAALPRGARVSPETDVAPLYQSAIPLLR